ncbi:MAG: metallophosphoesterase family protein [Opitutae bacterium]|nr:metallophosphoesterase family protein [Opitutae bacterium]
MRILHCSDFHGNKRWFDWLVDEAANYDLVCLTGDHLDLFNYHQLGDQLSMINATLRRITTPLALCSGNHDSFSGGPPVDSRLFQAKWLREVRRPGVWIDGDQFELFGQNLRCVGWNAQVSSAAGNEIWLFHAPPAHSLVSAGIDGSEAGDEILGEICRAGNGPGIVLSGHQHDPRRWACRIGHTWCFNPGYDRNGACPNHISIDTASWSAVLYTDRGAAATMSVAPRGRGVF